jgi:hypothetical protein
MMLCDFFEIRYLNAMKKGRFNAIIIYLVDDPMAKAGAGNFNV